MSEKPIDVALLKTVAMPHNVKCMYRVKRPMVGRGGDIASAR